jgi:hypothetical protein
MKKILIALMLLAGAASGQTYNVSVTNSLLGPVTLVVSGTVNNVTNQFAPVNNISNAFQSIVSVTNIIGETTVVNSNTFFTSITNDVDVAGVTVTNNTIFEGTFTQTIITRHVYANHHHEPDRPVYRRKCFRSNRS